jgi:hypothetical protein
LNINPRSQTDLAKVDNYRKYGLNNFSIGLKGGTFENNWPQTDEEINNLTSLYRSYGEILKFNNMLHYNYIYAWDEGQIGNPQVKKICEMIHKSHPQLKTMVCYQGLWDPSNDSDWGKDIDIWCFLADKFDEQKVRALQNLGKELWTYVCGPIDYDTPNLLIDYDSIDYRIIPWMCWRFKIKGFLYWSVIWWLNVDPFQSAANEKWGVNGDGLLYYPGENGPISSIRLEVLRDGLDDYEYLHLLSQKILYLKDKKLIT